MDLEKLIERVVGELRERAVAANVLLTEPASDVLRAAFAEVRRATLVEARNVTCGCCDRGMELKNSKHNSGRWNCYALAIRRLLPPAAEGAAPEAPFGECGCGAEMDEHGCPFGH